MNEKFARWTILLQQNLKRDWKKITFWINGIGLFSGGFIPAFEEIAKDQGLANMFEVIQNPVMISIYVCQWRPRPSPRANCAVWSREGCVRRKCGETHGTA